MIHRTSLRRRGGFTLIEALVVTAILAILFGMTTSAVVRALQTAEDARVVMEMKQIEAAIGTFKAEYGVSYMPSKIRLRAKLSDYYPIAQGGTNNTPDLLDELSRDVLFTMFPRLDKSRTIAWTTSSQPIILDGPECLVLFLGGKNGIQGWSKYQLDPWNGPPTGTDNRVKSHYDFTPDRLMKRNGYQGFPSYRDPYLTGQPYVYFSSRKSGNDYSPTRNNDYSAMETYLGPDQANATDKIRPFYDSINKRFVNANSFQLMCAGRDGLFGAFTVTNPSNAGFRVTDFVQWNNGQFGTQWNTGTPLQTRAPIDDLANFHPTKLSIPQ